MAPGAKIVIYFAPNTSQGFQDALTTAIHDATNKPSVISISWGGPESTWTAQSMTAFDSAAQDGAALGVTTRSGLWLQRIELTGSRDGANRRRFSRIQPARPLRAVEQASVSAKGSNHERNGLE